ncbi:DUF1292 domain-containing protein [Ectobacillus antri]|jgi:hypothetical protein|uniref:DUF1292 domain-containing protein n=1 Tax=Ectobacillus antri TaxID=2486280 RepID=A0ABT6H4D0_9BACI|nr:DUF1292 domain-containing protein [Ectobacillus antri]MDG4657519.1 DUF1292 domain-containing protein [Ectobacillus antri]MDG5753832.1 DUF1292 domain-containing protein [Ectobacillus antri]
MEEIKVGDVFAIGDEGEEQEVEVLGTMHVEGHAYIAVGLLEDIQSTTEEEMDVFLFKVEENGELSYIEDDTEFEKVSAEFERVTSEEV